MKRFRSRGNRSSVSRVILLIAVLLPTMAFAWPVDVYEDLQAGKDEIRKLAAISWAEVEDPTVATVEVLPSGELLLTGKAPGRTLVLLYAEGKFAVWRIRVTKPGTTFTPSLPNGEPLPELTAAKAACKGLQADAESLRASIATDACRKSLLALFQTDAYQARDLELTFELAALQAQLADIEKALKSAGISGVTLHYSGAGVVLEGTATNEEHKTALWTIFKNSVGRVPVDDRVELAKP